MLSDQEIRQIFAEPRTIAVVGLSDNPQRASYSVTRLMQQVGHRIIPVNPTLETPVLGEQPYKRLRDVTVPVDVVDIFRRSEYVPEIIEDAIAIGAKVIWMQLGVIHHEAAARAEQTGLGVVIDRCMAIEYRRFKG